MESFHWDKHFLTGIETVDQQHHGIVDLINQFGSMLAADQLFTDDIERVFRELTDYAQFHFQEEEKMMLQAGIDQRHIHHQIKEHRTYLQEVAAMYKGISSDNPNAANDLLDFLTQWLAYHILGTDQNMARQLKLIRAGSTPGEAYEEEERARDAATGPLLAALNGLFLQVSARNKELVQLNASLEATVEERTRALSEANTSLEKLSLTDVLTGLPNRRHAMARLENLWDEAPNTALVCMMIDADHFKEVNDTYGHDAGDLVLCELAKTLQHAVRNDDIVCRLGGDEFFIICPDTDQHGGMHLAELVCKTVSELRIPTGDGTWHGSISVGVASRSADMDDHNDLIKAADNGVYAAKRDGKNCVRAVNPDYS